LLVAVVTAVMALSASCGTTDSEDESTDSANAINNSSFEAGVTFDVKDVPGDVAVLAGEVQSIEDLFSNDEMRGELFAELFAGSSPLWADVAAPGSVWVVDGPLPDNDTRNRDEDCTRRAVILIDHDASMLHVVHPGLCGLETPPGSAGAGTAAVGIEFTEDGVNVADTRLLESGLDPSATGTVGLDRAGQRHLRPGEPIEIDVSTFDGEDNLGQDMCIEVTVRAGFAGTDGIVGSRVSIGYESTQTSIPEPENQRTRRQVAQAAHSVETWSLGPFNLDASPPDQITVTTDHGEIVDWDASARHC
jgi:hypothetical protein